MAFIDKKDPVVLNIKITSKGRESLSQGQLHFKYFAIGDGEIDYNYLNNNQLGENIINISPSRFEILRPADKNPNIISFISRNPLTQTDLLDEFSTNNQYNPISTVPSIAWEVENIANDIGFFNKSGDTFIFKHTEEFIKQPDLMVNYNTINGNVVRLFQAPTYGANRNNPQVGDYLLIRWKDTNANFETTGYTINKQKATPILIYRIIGVTGNITNDNLEVVVDRNLPDFSGNINVGAMILYGDTTANIEQQYSTDYASEALISFLQNCQCDTITFPFWKLSIIYTENLPGITSNNKQLVQHKTAPFVGFVNYIQNHKKIYNKLGIIHYTNVSPANTYAEQFLRRTPMIHIPTIMWHKSSGNTIGVTFKAIGDLKMLVSNDILIPSLNTHYYDLADDSGNVVGKVFIELKIFVIEDPELLFAMSYKSNRSWTLPNFNIGANDSITDCPMCSGNIEFTYRTENTESIGGSSGSITIINVSGLILDDPQRVYVKIERTSGVGGIFYSEILGNFGRIFGNLPAGTYKITIIDLSAPYAEDCKTEVTNIIISDPLIISPYYYGNQTGFASNGIGLNNLI